MNSRSNNGVFNRPSGEWVFSDGEFYGNGVPPPADVLSGFDAVIQCSRDLLQVSMARSLSAKGLAALGAHVPWNSALVTPLLRAAVAERFKHGGARMLGERHLEVRLVRPYLQQMQWPDVSLDPVVPPVVSGRAAKSAARAVRARSVDVGWQLEINLLVAALPPSANEVSLSSSSAPANAAPAGAVIANVGSLGLGPTGEVSGPSWRRIPIGVGQAVTAAVANTVVTPSLLRFGMVLDFAEVPPSTSSDDPLVTEFLASSACHDLLTQTLAPLLSADGVNLSPPIAPAGRLSSAQVQRMNLPPLNVHDVLLTDSRGAPVLCLCVDLGNTSQGVLRLVQPFLEAADFAYAVSIRLLGPVLIARWRVLAAGLVLTSDVPVELRISESSEETATGRARVQLRLSDALTNTIFRPSETAADDPLRLISEETTTLLGLWDYQGQQIELGPLAEPQVESLVMYLDLFGTSRPPNPGEQINPTLKAFFLKLLSVTFFPVMESIRIRNLSGFTSSATQAAIARWQIRTARDDVRPTGPQSAGGISL